MSDFTKIGTTSKYSSGTASPSVAYVSRNGTSVLVGIWMASGSVSGISDDQGNDSTGSPINTWVQLSSVALGGAGQLEVWEARNVVTIGQINIVLSGAANCVMAVGEFSGLGNAKTAYTTTNASATALTLDETGSDDSECFIGFCATPSSTQTGYSAGTRLELGSNASAAPEISLADNTITKLTCTAGVNDPMLMIAVSFNVGISFDHIPGFSDLSDAVLAAEELALGRKIATISENAAFGMVRVECFSNYYKNGDTVPLPVSPVDGYAYERDELVYIWGIRDTVSQTSGTGWASGKDSIWYLAMKVDQATGTVSCSIGYRRSGGNWTPTVSDDGLLYVVTVAQRQRTSLILAAVPNYTETDDSIYVQDAALTQSDLQNLNDNAKAAVVKTEIIPMGEFINGQTIPQPVSPADGFVYDYARVKFGFSWRWTGPGSVFTQPGKSVGQQAQMKASITSVGVVSCSVSFVDDSDTLTNRTTYGRISVFAICSRVRTVAVSSQRQPWDSTVSGNVVWGVATPDGLPPIRIPVTPGQTVTCAGSGTAKFAPASGVFDANGSVADEALAGPTNFPNHYSTTSALGVLGVMGTFVDATGLIITIAGVKQIYEIGKGPVTLTVPAGAVYLQLGANDLISGFLDNAGTYYVSLKFGGGAATYKDFLELDTDQFMPGNKGVRASVMKQIDHNCKEAILATETFGPTSHANGDTIALPVGADGYTYTRAEVEYLWEWSDTTDQTGSNLREVAFYGRIDPTSGKVILQVWRLPPGGPAESDNDTLCRINVIMIAHRQRSLATAATADPAPPADISTTITDNNTATTINGV